MLYYIHHVLSIIIGIGVILVSWCSLMAISFPVRSEPSCSSHRVIEFQLFHFEVNQVDRNYESSGCDFWFRACIIGSCKFGNGTMFYNGDNQETYRENSRNDSFDMTYHKDVEETTLLIQFMKDESGNSQQHTEEAWNAFNQFVENEKQATDAFPCIWQRRHTFNTLNYQNNLKQLIGRPSKCKRAKMEQIEISYTFSIKIIRKECETILSPSTSTSSTIMPSLAIQNGASQIAIVSNGTQSINQPCEPRSAIQIWLPPIAVSVGMMLLFAGVHGAVSYKRKRQSPSNEVSISTSKSLDQDEMSMSMSEAKSGLHLSTIPISSCAFSQSLTVPSLTQTTRRRQDGDSSGASSTFQINTPTSETTSIQPMFIKGQLEKQQKASKPRAPRKRHEQAEDQGEIVNDVLIDSVKQRAD